MICGAPIRSVIGLGVWHAQNGVSWVAGSPLQLVSQAFDFLFKFRGSCLGGFASGFRGCTSSLRRFRFGQQYPAGLLGGILRSCVLVWEKKAAYPAEDFGYFSSPRGQKDTQ